MPLVCELCGKSYADNQYMAFRSHIIRFHGLENLDVYRSMVKHGVKSVPVPKIFSYVSKTFVKFRNYLLHRCKHLYRVCSACEIEYWEKFRRFKVSECTVHRRCPMAIVPGFIFGNAYAPEYRGRCFNYATRPNLINAFILAVNLERLLERTEIYPAVYGLPHATEEERRRVLNCLCWKYVHPEMWNLLYETEVFTVQDVHLDDIDRVILGEIPIEESRERVRRFFEEHGIEVVDVSDASDTLEFWQYITNRFLAPVAKFPMYPWWKHLREYTDYQKMAREYVLKYNELISEWLEKLGVRRASVDKCIAVPHMAPVLEVAEDTLFYTDY